ncbi:MAG: glycerophosphodiester phosphodiesterase [Clostridia bacterium]|nr:glycerophosphodiester phosphodiesterase [Clostridia bacterium]
MSEKLWQPREDFIPVLGHRGIRDKYPENTLVSFDAAIALGCDLIEFDVNITKDGVPVVIHDNKIDRTCIGHTGAVRDYTLAELKTFDFSADFADTFKDTKIPTLREVLELGAKDPELCYNIEIKDYTEECVDKTIALVREFGIAERVVIASFSTNVLLYTQRAYPEMRTQGFPPRVMNNPPMEMYDKMYGIGVPISWGERNEEEIAADVAFAKEHNILPWLFCADTEEDVLLCVKHGCANITGNNPEVALTTLRKIGKHQ